ncbi:MAG: metalloregulator ArsR/SmtB family transcription factor [Oscillochloridaceae bacterium]|nr:metalloregulator ArsR/SmtB family transcription factor [Chloroflexaceae bacterium]MDW8390752.1 metalloregulator ArsR/SmtB family transcription factor [Oscillochloridaceae bacterium]
MDERGQATLEQLKLLADETRWRLLLLLRCSDYQVGELVERTGLAQNLISYHLNVLRQAGLVRVHRSDADARANYYSAHLPGLIALHHGLAAGLALPTAAPIPERMPPVVFLCRANSARSQMAEGWLRALSGARITVRSAGTHPAPLHPLAVQVMAEAGIDIGYQQTKHVDTLADLASAVVVTVCDIAREECAVWLRAAIQLHWSIADPVAVEDEAERLRAFRAVRDEVRERVSGLLPLLPSLMAATRDAR